MAQDFKGFEQVVRDAPSCQADHGDASVLRDNVTVVNLIGTVGWYHSTADTPDLIPPQGLERMARAFAYFSTKWTQPWARTWSVARSRLPRPKRRDLLD